MEWKPARELINLARTLMDQGHDARLMPAQYVKPYLKTNKNDYLDAETIAEAVQRPTTVLGAKHQKPGHIRRLVWADGTAIENGWRPTTPHEPKPVRRRERVTRAA